MKGDRQAMERSSSTAFEDPCKHLSRALAACERACAGRCAATARACDQQRDRLRQCLEDSSKYKITAQQQNPPPPSPPPPPPTDHSIKTSRETLSSCKDRNGRAYHLQHDGSVRVEDVGVLPNKCLPPPPELPKLSTISCGSDHCIAVSIAGQCLSWATSVGGGRFGQLGWDKSSSRSRAHLDASETYVAKHVTLPHGTGRVASATAGDNHTAIVTESGGLWLCGSDRWTQLGQDRFWERGAVWLREPQECQTVRKEGVSIVKASCGADHTLALDAKGRVWAFGRGEHGQLFGSSKRPFTAPPQVSPPLLATPATDVFASSNCSCAYSHIHEAWTCIGRCSHVSLR